MNEGIILAILYLQIILVPLIAYMFYLRGKAVAYAHAAVMLATKFKELKK